MFPGESHEWLDNDGEGLFTEPPKKKGRRTYGKLELKPPDFETPEFGGGNRRPVITLQAAGLLCIVLTTGSTLDTTLPYKAPSVMIFSKIKTLSPGCAFIRVIPYYNGTLPGF